MISLQVLGKKMNQLTFREEEISKKRQVVDKQQVVNKTYYWIERELWNVSKLKKMYGNEWFHHELKFSKKNTDK